MNSPILGIENLDPAFYVLFYALIFLYGICVGSFLNVVILRLPNEESLTKRASHCMTCGAKIKTYDLIPVFSWLFLRGKCRNCGEKISPRYPIVESLNGFAYVLIFLVMDITPKAIISTFLFSLLIVIGFMDWDTLEIDIRLLGLIALLAVPSAIFCDDLTIMNRICGALYVSVPFFIIGEVSGAVIKKRTGEKIRGIELGDTVLMAVSGLVIGHKASIFSAFVGIILAGICGMIHKRLSGESKFAFGPFLSIGIAAGTLWGNQAIDWYLNLLLPAEPAIPALINIII